jgi:hypothetical protein
MYLTEHRCNELISFIRHNLNASGHSTQLDYKNETCASGSVLLHSSFCRTNVKKNPELEKCRNLRILNANDRISIFIQTCYEVIIRATSPVLEPGTSWGNYHHHKDDRTGYNVGEWGKTWFGMTNEGYNTLINSSLLLKGYQSDL